MKSAVKTLIGVVILLAVVFGVVFLNGNKDATSDSNFEEDFMMDSFDGNQMTPNENMNNSKGMPDINMNRSPGGEMSFEDTESCEGLSEDDACTITNPQGESVNGTCNLMEENLVCMMQRPEGEMPQEEMPPME